jgi:hypothetical protein
MRRVRRGRVMRRPPFAGATVVRGARLYHSARSAGSLAFTNGGT